MSKTKLYRVATKGSDVPRVIEAVSESAALKHAAFDMFTAALIRSPVETAQLLALPGVKLEKAGEHAADQPDPNAERVNVDSGMVEKPVGEGGGEPRYEDVRPATLAELLAEAGDGARFRVNTAGGMVQRHVGEGADDNDANWSDVREATAEEIADATPASDPPPAAPKSGKK
jgi:hypothetical protein